jgi:FkbM family methyltransferase
MSLIQKTKIILRSFFPTAANRLLFKLKTNRLSPISIPLELIDGKRVVGLNPFEAYCEYKDLFINRIYEFSSEKKDPLIIDGGAYVGFSVNYFKTLFPSSKIIAFECDPDIFKVLEKNVKDNKLSDVKLVNSALAKENGKATFYGQGTDGGSLIKGEGSTDMKVTTCKLSEYLDQPVDFLKLNIEGAEFEVLAECESKLRNVSEMVIEFHSFNGEEQRLQELLTILSRNGFRYMINHFDYESNLAVKPPFTIDDKTTYILLVYAKRLP